MKKRLRYYIFLLILIAAGSCKTGNKISIDINQFPLNQFYIAELNGKKLYARITEVGEGISGEYFFAGNNAVTTVNKFKATPDDGKIRLTYFTANDSVVYYVIPRISADSIILSYSVKPKIKADAPVLVFLKEKQQSPLKITNRYKEEIFKKTDFSTRVFGNAEGYYASKLYENVSPSNYGTIISDVAKSIAKNLLMKNLDLEMDIYQPSGDTASKRPLIVLIHGGAFIIGDKRSETMTDLSAFYAKQGYVVASINYRLGYIILPGQYDYLERCIYRAVQDARAAIRYLVHNAALYKIDVSRIVVGGNSAGGFTALNVAFMKEDEKFESVESHLLKLQKGLGCLDCSSNKYKENFSVKGVINMWGALTDINLMDEDEKVPVISFHGDDDNIVPIDFDYPFRDLSPEITAFFVKKVFGSRALQYQANKLKINYELVTFPKAKHEPQLDDNNKFNQNYDIIKNKTIKFLYNIITSGETGIKGKSIVFYNDSLPVYNFAFRPAYKYYWMVSGGKIVNVNKTCNEAKVVWFENSTEKRITLQIINDVGAAKDFLLDVKLTGKE
ncbi:MAG: alpha/beta hydrolase [Bacteroidia bacterium]|nr:alpha/beta hydrolase [Bacteroidia bacterium]